MDETLQRKRRDSAQQHHRVAGPHRGCGLRNLALGSAKGDGESYLIYHCPHPQFYDIDSITIQMRKLRLTEFQICL